MAEIQQFAASQYSMSLVAVLSAIGVVNHTNWTLIQQAAKLLR
jgi:hypothetical protein